MIFVDDFLDGINLMLHPSAATSKKMDIGKAFSYYYKMTIVPLVISEVLAILFAVFMLSIIKSSLVFTSILGGFGALDFIALPLLILWILIPISIFISAGLYHIFGKLFRQFKNSYSATVTAVVYSVVPTVLFYWAIIIPVLGGIISFVMGIWGFIVLVIALSKQQKISTGAAFGIAILVPIIIGIIVVIIVALFAIGVFLPILMSHNFTSAQVPYSGAAGYNYNYTVAPQVQNPSVSSSNYSSCNGFTLSSNSWGSTIRGVCSWTGGKLYVYAGGGTSGWEAVKITGADNVTYLSQSSSTWHMSKYGAVYLPSQDYFITLATGQGGGAYGNAAVELKAS
ncbi:MAG: hypothetical protein ACP5K9_00755 [Candidatus Micrarchaeia archaeon]